MAGSERGDRAWVRGAQRGSVADLEALFRHHWPRAYRAAYLVVHDSGAAEDIAQEAFLAAVRSLDRFDRRRPFGPWLHRIVANRALDLLRAERRLSSADLPEPVDLSSPYESGDRGLLGAVADLSLERRVVVGLRYGVGMTPKQIGETLDVPVGTVNSRLARALEQLRESLEVEHVE
jgi:RNA polymerase sigma-70 factor, ECF subfamily